MSIYSENILPIGTKVTKKSRKPFKSGLKVNTIKGYIIHSITQLISYKFEEDDSYVEVRRCVPLTLLSETILDNILSNSDVDLNPTYGFYSDDYDADDILKVIADIFYDKAINTFKFNIKSGDLIKTFNVNIQQVFIKYLSKFNKDPKNWLIAENGEYPEFVKEV